jgi:hypothetical protein
MELEERLEEIQGARDTLDGALQRWRTWAARAGVETGEKKDTKKKKSEPKPEPAPEPKKARQAMDYEEPVIDDVPIVDERPGGQRETIVRGSGMREDVSAVFETKPAAAALEAIGAEDVEAIAVGEVEEDVMVDEDDGPNVSWKGSQASDEEMVLEPAGADLGIDADAAPPSTDSPGEEPRRALLLYQEGTAEEQIYPFTGTSSRSGAAATTTSRSRTTARCRGSTASSSAKATTSTSRTTRARMGRW